jgi:hypothetical protein
MANSSRLRTTLVGLPLLLAVAVLPGCGGRASQKAPAHDLTRPLSQLADQGPLEALQILADLEVLRAQGVFADSTADRLVAQPASTFLDHGANGAVVRSSQGRALTALLGRGAWSESQRATLQRRAAQDLIAAAAWADSAAAADTTRTP